MTALRALRAEVLWDLSMRGWYEIRISFPQINVVCQRKKKNVVVFFHLKWDERRDLPNLCWEGHSIQNPISKDLKQKWVSASQLAEAQGSMAQAGPQWGQRKWRVSTMLASLLTPLYSAPQSHWWYLEAFLSTSRILWMYYIVSSKEVKNDWEFNPDVAFPGFISWMLLPLLLLSCVKDVWLISSPESRDQFSSLLVWTSGHPKEITSSCCPLLPCLWSAGNTFFPSKIYFAY